MDPLLLVMILLLVFLVSYKVLWVPLRVQAHFRAQGITGPGYRPIVGNLPEMRRLYAEVKTKSTPKESTHDVLERVLPFHVKWSREYGKTFLLWFGWRPRLAVTDPEMIKEVLQNTGDMSFAKVPLHSSARRLFGPGLVGLEGDKWTLQSSQEDCQPGL